MSLPVQTYLESEDANDQKIMIIGLVHIRIQTNVIFMNKQNIFILLFFVGSI